MNSRLLIRLGPKKLVERILQVTRTTLAPTSALVAANRYLPATSITAHASKKLCRWSLAGHTKRPRSSRFAKKHNPSPSYHSTLMRSPRRPRNTNTCPENGLCSSFVCTCALSPVKPRRKSVTPAAIQIRVFAGNAIMPANTPAQPAPIPDRRCPQSAPAPDETRCGSYRVVVGKNP